MKMFLASVVLLSSLSTFAEYRENEDGSLSYIGKCLLHEDYEGVKFDSTEVIPYTNYPTNEFFSKIPKIFKRLATIVHDVEVGPYQDDVEYDLEGFDDISFDLIKVKNSNETLYRVSFGVGGGNGGYQTFSVQNIKDIQLEASTFDGDLLECSEKFTK
jgi:hypothetical protein